MQLELEFQQGRGPALLIASSAEAAWEGGMSEWFARAIAEAWQNERPTVVALPTRGHVHALKARLLAEGRSIFGIQFLTPLYLRALLDLAVANSSPHPEHLRLLLALGAEELITEKSLAEAERLAAVSVRRTPNHLLHLLEQLSTAGVDFESVDLPVFRPVVEKFRQHLAETNFTLDAEADRQALARAKKDAPIIGRLLVTGFHGAHWPFWHLLRAAVASAENATVLLQYPRTEAADLDTAWVGSWEEQFGEAKPIEAADEPAPGKRETLFLAGLDTREQAGAIVGAAHHFLADPRCTRLGILFPAAGALARLVAAALTREGIPHYDAMGQRAPGIFEASVFWAWMELQRTPRLNALRRFLTALESDHPIFEKISRRSITDALERALGSLAIDELAILVASARGRDAKGELLSAALAQIRFLPERATFEKFLDATQDAFCALGWHERWREVEQRTPFAPVLRSNFSRTLYLQWLEESAVSLRITRDVSGQHVYSRVHLFTPAQAEDQSWSHLIFTGMNENSWPATTGGDFLPTTQIESLNQHLQKLNRTATRRGRQGEGHLAVREGRTPFLGSAQRRLLGEAQFASLLENTRHGLAFTASLISEDAPERISNPSEFLNRACHHLHARSLSQQQMRTLREATRRWLDGAPLEPQLASIETPGVLQTCVAYDARRVIAKSGEYDFALRKPPEKIEPLSVSALDEMLKAPAQVWLRRYLGVEGEEESTHVWQATVGKWAHEWLASMSEKKGEGFAPFPRLEEIEKRIFAAAKRKRAEVEQLCHQVGRRLPDWWESGWEGALCIAQTLGRLLGVAEGWSWLAPEWRLEAQPIEFGEERRLLLRGRADLLLARTDSPPASLAVPALWIVDFKTGNKDALSKGLTNAEQRLDKVRRKVLKGDALQLSLYAVAAKQLGAQEVSVSLLSPKLTAAEPQLSAGDFENCRRAFAELAQMQATGVFGFRGALRGAFTFTRPYPIATLAVEREIVDERWEETHPDLVLEENYWQ